MSGDVLGYLEGYDLDALDVSGLPRFLELARQVVRGEFDLSLTGILTAGGNVIFAEFFTHGALMRQLLLIAVLGALIHCLTQNFSHKGAGEMGFYVTFLLTILLAVSSFGVAAGVLMSLTDTAVTMMRAAVPVMVTLLAISGNFAGAAAFHPLLFFALQLVAGFIGTVFVPLVFAATALDAVNYLNADNRLDKLAELLRKIADYTLRAIVGVFMLLLTLQRITAPVISNTALRTTRSVAGAVPVVGNALTAAMDTVVHFSHAARSGVLVALVIIIATAMLTPLLKILVLSWVYRLVAAIVQPISDERLSLCMEAAGKAMSQMFAAAALLGIMCIYTVVILLSV